MSKLQNQILFNVAEYAQACFHHARTIYDLCQVLLCFSDTGGDRFIGSGIMATSVIILDVLLLIVCFCSIHFLRCLDLCMGFDRRHPQSVVKEYRK